MPMLTSMQRIWGALRTRRARRIVNALSAVFFLAVGWFAYRHFADSGWPLAKADPAFVAASGLCFLLAYGFKAYGWARLFPADERPGPLALACAGGAASVTGAALPGRFDDVVRVAVVRRYPGSTSCVPSVCLSLFMLGLVDAAALMPLASTAAATTDASTPVRAALAVVAAAGLGAGVMMTILPRLVLSTRLLRFRITRWLRSRTTSAPDAWKAWVLVLASWITRGVALLFLLQALGVSVSIPLAIAFLCAGAASAALPIAPAGAATQAGAGAALLIASGVGATQAVAFAIAAQALVIFAGAAVVVFAGVWQGGKKLARLRAAPA
jgi:hypothetical protein